MRRISEIARIRNLLLLPPTATVKYACDVMRRERAAAVLVTDIDRQLLGIFTERDAVRVLAEGQKAKGRRLADAMTPNPNTMPPDTTAIEALRLMQDCGFRHVPVVENGRLVGVVCKEDFRGLEQDRLEEEIWLWERL